MLNWLTKKHKSRARPSCAIGLMSGTSLDGLDACLIRETEFNGPIEVLATHHAPIPEFSSQIFRTATETGRIDFSDLLKAEVEYTDAVAKQCIELMAQYTETASIIGFHGQTLWHSPDIGNTLQVGFAEALAVATQIPVAHQFRRSDMARTGQGAPLAPLFHQHQFSRDTETVAVLNLGGIANLTLLIPGKPPVGWDIGPANTLSDQWYRLHNNESFDRDGHLASRTESDLALLKCLLDDPYFDREPPKSTGREYFNLKWLTNKLASMPPIRSDSVQATLNHFTATLIQRALPENIDILAVCGGGVHNIHLMEHIDGIVDSLVVTTDTFSIDPDYVEAACFGWLGLQTLRRNAVDLRSVTGTSAIAQIGSLVYP